VHFSIGESPPGKRCTFQPVFTGLACQRTTEGVADQAKVSQTRASISVRTYTPCVSYPLRAERPHTSSDGRVPRILVLVARRWRRPAGGIENIHDLIYRDEP
jgi:hypothetical protein